MRNPNGYGGISYLGENRRNPFRVRITTGWEYNEKTGRQKQMYATLGYYPTRKAAMIALGKYNEDPYDLNAGKVTFEEIFEKWSFETYPDISASAKRGYNSAFQKFKKIHKTKMGEIKKAQIQQVFNEHSHLSKAYQEKMRTVVRGMFKFCIENDIVTKDYSAFIKITATDTEESIHTPYTEDEIRLLWDNISLPIGLKYSAKDIRNIYPVDLILIMIYTGMRPGELLEIKCSNVNMKDRYMIGGIKTAAGKNRIIPLHDDIIPLIEKRLQQGGRYLVPYKSDNPPTTNQYRKYMFDGIMEELKLEHLPHDGRHTFATFADKCDLNPNMVKRIMGHTIDDITQNVYTHKDAADLVNAVNQITFLKK